MGTGSPSASRKWFSHWNIPLIFQLWIFLLFLLFFQLGWESFENEINSFPLFVSGSNFIGNLVLNVTPAVLNPLFDITIVRSGISLILPDGFYVSYFFHLSGIKQMVLIILLFLLLQGSWKKKLWYIPVCLFILFLTVFIRFIMLTLHCVIYPEHIHLIQTMLFSPLLYFELVMMWAAWVLLIAQTASLKNYPPRTNR